MFVGIPIMSFIVPSINAFFGVGFSLYCSSSFSSSFSILFVSIVFSVSMNSCSMSTCGATIFVGADILGIVFVSSISMIIDILLHLSSFLLFRHLIIICPSHSGVCLNGRGGWDSMDNTSCPGCSA